MNDLTIAVEVVRPGYYPELPTPATPGSAGLDLRACIDQELLLWPNEARRVPSGLKVAIPPGYAMFAIPRSGLGSRGLVLGNLVGLIDSDFRGEIEISLWNRGDAPQKVTPGMLACQAVVLPVMRVVWQPVDKLDDTERGEGGFGHTGEL